MENFTYYSWWTLNGLWKGKTPAIVTIQCRLWMNVYLVVPDIFVPSFYSAAFFHFTHIVTTKYYSFHLIIAECKYSRHKFFVTWQIYKFGASASKSWPCTAFHQSSPSPVVCRYQNLFTEL